MSFSANHGFWLGFILPPPWGAGNLLVDETLRVRVADFGLARVMHDLTTLTGGCWQLPALARSTELWRAPGALLVPDGQPARC